jgi:hypothetical protein
MDNIRITDRREECTSRPPSIHCETIGCGRATHDGKPFCSHHVSNNDYIRKVMKQIARRQRQQRG